MRILSFSQQWILRTFLNMDHWFHLPERARPPSVQLWTCRGGQPGVTRPRSGRAGPAQTRRAADLSAPPRSSVTHGRHRRGSRGSGPQTAGVDPPKFGYFSNFFIDFFPFSNIFKIKWPKSEEKLNFWGRWVWVPMNPTPPPNQNFVATPLLLRHSIQSPMKNFVFIYHNSPQILLDGVTFNHLRK